MTQLVLGLPNLLKLNAVAAELEPSPSELVFVFIIIKSVLILGRRTLGATTPQASLRRRYKIEK